MLWLYPTREVFVYHGIQDACFANPPATEKDLDEPALLTENLVGIVRAVLKIRAEIGSAPPGIKLIQKVCRVFFHFSVGELLVDYDPLIVIRGL